MEEPTTAMQAPAGSSLKAASFVNTTNPATFVPITATPLLCGNTSQPVGGAFVSPSFYSSNGSSGATSRPFVFGASFLAPSTSAVAGGASVSMSGTSMRLTPADTSLVCYGVDASGAHGPTVGVMRDGFQGLTYSPTLNTTLNSSVVLTVFHVPANSADFYGYTVDVTIPTKPGNLTCNTGAVDCNFALLEGYDTSVFDPNGQATHADEGWCLGSTQSTNCLTSSIEGGINLNYSTWPGTLLPKLTLDTPGTYRFVVKRYFRSGVTSLPASGDPVAIAALFSPFDLDENFIGDNVSAGFANSPPQIVMSDPAWTTFSNGLASLSENTNSGSLAFNITDADSPGAMTAAVTLNLGPLSIPVTPTCAPGGTGTGAANYQCSFSVNLASGSWWDGSVASVYQGLGNAFATDPGGVGATATIVVSDSNGKKSAPATVAIHVQSTANNAPAFGFAASLPSAPDPKQGGSSFPTYSCSKAANNCGATFHVVTLEHAVSAQPGPAAALDELAAQTVAINDVACGQAGENDAIFVNSPVGAASTNSSTDFDLSFQFPSTLVTGSSLCDVVISDAADSFPNGQTAKTTTKQFRVVVNP